jgi:hypothetical protein
MARKTARNKVRTNYGEPSPVKENRLAGPVESEPRAPVSGSQPSAAAEDEFGPDVFRARWWPVPPVDSAGS